MHGNTDQFRGAAKTRREFLRGSIAAALAVSAAQLPRTLLAAGMLEPYAAATPLAPPAGAMLQQKATSQLGLIMGPGVNLRPDGSAAEFISIVDLDAVHDRSYTLYQIPLDFFGHGIVPDPINPERAVVFQKKGKGACEVDLKALEVVRPITTGGNRKFYGHGAFSPDGSLLYATETVMDADYTGLITVRDARSHEELGQFPTFGSAPHDCWLIDAGKTMVVTNGGGPMDGARPCVTYVDVAAERLIEKLEFESPAINAGHLAVSSAGDLAVVSAQRDGLDPYSSTGGVSLRPAGGEFHTVTEPQDVVERLFGETLSVCIDERHGVVAATTPVGNTLTFWDIDSGELLRYYPAHNPRGIALTADGRFFVLSYEKPACLSLIASDSLDKVSGVDLQGVGTSGSHIFSYSLPEELRA